MTDVKGLGSTSGRGPDVRLDGRRERSRRTRRAIVDAAADLFVARGYAASTIADIAGAAGVAVPTVYASFGTKAAVMAAALDQAIAGDDAEVAVNAREWMGRVWTAPTAAERLTAYAAACRRIVAGAGGLFAAVAAAASVDAELAELAADAEQRRRTGATSVVDAVLEVGALREGLDREAAIDVLWLLNGPAVFTHLVRHAGWSLDRYERWLAGALRRELLGG